MVFDDVKQFIIIININVEVFFRFGFGSLYLKNGLESIMNLMEYLYGGFQGQLLYFGDYKVQVYNKVLFLGLSKEQVFDCSSSDGFERSWMDDYDYVYLQGKEEFER